MLQTIPDSKAIFYIGVDDKTIDLFESQYSVPNGVSYNSYVIQDEKLAIMDTVDPAATEQWMENLMEVLGDRQPDYLIISHMEPDHAGSIDILTSAYPEMTDKSDHCCKRGGHSLAGRTHPAFCHGTYGALAGGHGQL